MLDVINHGMLALMVSVGHQTDLFNLMADLPPSTSTDIATQAGLQERYVQEWLGAMVTGKIVEYDSDAKTFFLPPEHAAFLTHSAGPDNLARISQYVAMLGLVEQDILDCFRNGGGVPYKKFPRLQSIMGEGAKLNFDGALIGRIIPLSGMVDKLEGGIRVLDVGCGQGHALKLMAQAYPNSQFSGYDFGEDAILTARQESTHLDNISFAVRDISHLNESQTYDLITAFDVIHDQAKPRQVLRQIHNALVPGGIFFMMDFRASSHLHENIDHPAGPFMYTISTMHCMTVSLALDGEGLGTVWGEQKAMELLAEAGFSTEIKHLPGDILNSYFVARKT